MKNNEKNKLDIDFKLNINNNSIYISDLKNLEKIIAIIEFDRVKDDIIKITRTFVDDSYRGLGLASLLVEKLVEYMINNKLHCISECTYVNKWFEEHEKIKMLLKI